MFKLFILTITQGPAIKYDVILGAAIITISEDRALEMLQTECSLGDWAFDPAQVEIECICSVSGVNAFDQILLESFNAG